MSVKSFLKKVLPNFVIDAYHWFRGNLMVRAANRWRSATDRSVAVIPGQLTYAQDGLYTVHNADFLSDARFMRAYELGRKAGIYKDSKIHWRAYVACWAALKGRDLPGDFVECGVYRGSMSRMIIDYVDFRNLPKKFYLLDTFSGIPEASVNEEERKHGRSAGLFEESFEAVQATFRDFPNVVLVRGMIPETLEQVPATQVAYLSIDMNAAAPEIAAAEFFWQKMVSGAVMVLDDYGWTSHIVQKRAFDEFAERHGVRVLPMPTGQGLIFKP